MSKTIVIPDEYFNLWIEFITEQETKMLKTLDDLRTLKNGEYENHAEKILSKISNYTSGYNPNMQMTAKVKYILKHTSEWMSSSEIVDYIVNRLEPDQKPNRKKIMGGVSSILTMNNGDGKFLKKKSNSSGENIYALADPLAYQEIEKTDH